MDKKLLEVKNLKTYFYSDGVIIKSVDDLSFYVNEGETLGIVGESGCGKSVACLSLARLVETPPGKYEYGEILFKGEDLLRVSDARIRQIRGNDISFIFQEPMTSLNPVFKIGRQISEVLILHRGISKEEAYEESIRMLELVKIPNPERVVNDYPFALSGGMRQRVMIAMALACKPGLLIADEPTSNLDVTIQAQVLDLMNELKEIKAAVQPDEILLVVDAMTGQDAVNVAESFNKELGLTGVVLTKLDGDTRGGAALSVKAVTGCPIKLVGVGEKLDALDVFYPDRMASRILGMGDVLSLVEKAQETFDAKKAKEMERKIRQQEFTLEDFLEQMQQVRSMGPLEDLLGMIPGLNKQLKGVKPDFDEKEIVHVEAIIKSMTPEERRNPTMINGSRKKRIARGSGTKVQEVNRLLKQFEESRKLMKQFADMGNRKGKKGGMPPMNFPFK